MCKIDTTLRQLYDNNELCYDRLLTVGTTVLVFQPLIHTFGMKTVPTRQCSQTVSFVVGNLTNQTFASRILVLLQILYNIWLELKSGERVTKCVAASDTMFHRSCFTSTIASPKRRLLLPRMKLRWFSRIVKQFQGSLSLRPSYRLPLSNRSILVIGGAAA